MSGLAATFTVNPLLDLAKRTMLPQGVRCQITTPEPCNAILACWEAYRLHLIHQHSVTVKKFRKNRQAGTTYTVTRKEWRCAFQCPNRVHMSRESLEQHMLSHMSEIPFSCPFPTCESRLRPLESEPTLIDHLDSIHCEQRGISSTELEGQLWWSSYSQSTSFIESPPWPDYSVIYLDTVNPHPFQPPPPFAFPYTTCFSAVS
ncbi:hypothetical protein J3R30DRAFT_707622 [Lentinula aciculospora]|uniref:C2H2-type domain-containing protein n=1 Tax=Lentinula aciculospora TaxID=153920 RepID=A0A9W9A4C7_9AGAR|nr:hypothetical protein J3R30DRAFT_707622 [Lentinula aciculospora]